MCVNAPEAVIEMAVRIQATIDCPEIEAFKEMVDQLAQGLRLKAFGGRLQIGLRH